MDQAIEYDIKQKSSIWQNEGQEIERAQKITRCNGSGTSAVN